MGEDRNGTTHPRGPSAGRSSWQFTNTPMAEGPSCTDKWRQSRARTAWVNHPLSARTWRTGSTWRGRCSFKNLWRCRVY